MRTDKGDSATVLDPARASEDQPPAWVVELMERARGLRTASHRDIEPARSAFWQLLHHSLLALLSMHRRRLGPVQDDDLLDIAAEKCADLLCRFEDGRWEPLDSTPWQCRGFLSKVARNGLVDVLRRARPDVIGGEEAEILLEGEADSGTDAQTTLAVDRAHFVAALVACLDAVSDRDRRIWVLRVVHDLSSRQIARHPDVRLVHSHVDVILHRCRRSIRSCLKGRGIESNDLPAGLFTELWLQLQTGKEGERE